MQLHSILWQCFIDFRFYNNKTSSMEEKIRQLTETETLVSPITLNQGGTNITEKQ